MKLRSIIVLILFTLFLPAVSVAQKYSFSGRVSGSNDKPLYFATINLKGTPIYDLSDENGNYTLKNVSPGKYILHVSILGFQAIEREIEIRGNVTGYDVVLEELSLALDEVVVTAKVSQSKEGSTTYKIGSEAIQQIQAISVSDILQLVPGTQVGTTGLNRMAQVNLRNAGEYTNLNAFGTAVIIDGNQLSNDGNMQTGGSVVTANKGIDLREISASNIESVEVISGVPSARYGNITSGAVIVNRKAGFTPWSFSFNSNPNSYQTGVNKGFKLKKGGFLNADADYTYSNAKTTSRKKFYQRVNTGLRWTREFSEKLDWSNNVALRYGLSFDGQRPDPDEKVVLGVFENRDHNISVSTNGSLRILGRTTYSLSANYRNQYSFKKLLEGGPAPLIEAIEEGTYITSFTPVQFYQKTEFLGAPLNINGRVESSQIFKTMGLRHNTSTGFEYAFDKNYGKGRVLDKENNAVSAQAGTRAMNYYNVPASEVYSLYFQDDISYDGPNSDYLIKLGLRYDNMLHKYNLLSPRLSLSGKYFEKVRLRLAYGISYRTPSMLQLFPGPSYFDVINLNHYSSDPQHSLAVITTYIYQPTHELLKPSRGTNFEGGFDIEHNGFTLRATGFYKSVEGGVNPVTRLLTFDRRLWDVLPLTPGIPAVAFATDSVTRVSSSFSNYENSIYSRTTGIELFTELPKIDATNTRISLSGSYLRTFEENEKPTIKSSASLTGSSANRYGVYDRPSYNTYLSRSNLTIAQHLPAIRMMVTIMTEVNWISKREVAEYPSPYPLAYYSIDGTYVDIPEAERSSAQYSDLYYSRSFLEETPVPAHFNFHIQIRKETKQGHNFSFYANNFLWYLPVYTDDLNKTINELNSRITFGLGFNFKI